MPKTPSLRSHDTATFRLEAKTSEGSVWYRASLLRFSGEWQTAPYRALEDVISLIPPDETVELLVALGVQITAVLSPEISKICPSCGLPLTTETEECPLCEH